MRIASLWSSCFRTTKVLVFDTTEGSKSTESWKSEAQLQNGAPGLRLMAPGCFGVHCQSRPRWMSLFQMPAR